MAGAAAHAAEAAPAKASAAETASAEAAKPAAIGASRASGRARGTGRRRTGPGRPGPSGRPGTAGAPEIAAQAPAQAEGEGVAQNVAEYQNQHHHRQNGHQDEHAQVHAAAGGGAGGLAAGQVHLVHTGHRAGHRIGAGPDGGVVILRRKVVLHGLGQGAGLPVDGGVAEAVPVGQIVVAVGIQGRLHHQQDQDAVVLAGAAHSPGVKSLGGVFLGGGVAGVLDRQHPDLGAGAVGLQQAVQLLHVGGGVLREDICVVHHALAGRQVGQGDGAPGRSGQPHRRCGSHRAGGQPFQDGFHPNTSTSLIPNSPLSTLAQGPPVSFW